MREKTTDDLTQELMEQADLDRYITENEAYFAEMDLISVLTRLYKKCGLSKAELARRAGMSEHAIISHGLLHHTPLAEINDKLFSENEKTLF